MKQQKLLWVIFLFSAMQLSAQTSEQKVKAAIDQMFDGMRKADSALVHQVFSDDVKMQTIMTDSNGEMQILTGSLTTFLTAVGTPHEEVWDERLKGYEIKIDGAMASVWTPYEFYRGDSYSHCGVNSFQLAELMHKLFLVTLL